MANASGGVVPLVGRILISQIFVLAGINKILNFSFMLGYVTTVHLPLPKISLGIAAAIELLGGLAVLAGFHTKLTAWILFLFLIPTTLLFHLLPALHGMDAQNNMIHFQKNLAIMGGLLILATLGAGRFAVDSSSQSTT